MLTLTTLTTLITLTTMSVSQSVYYCWFRSGRTVNTYHAENGNDLATDWVRGILKIKITNNHCQPKITNSKYYILLLFRWVVLKFPLTWQRRPPPLAICITIHICTTATSFQTTSIIFLFSIGEKKKSVFSFKRNTLIIVCGPFLKHLEITYLHSYMSHQIVYKLS